MRIGRSRRRLGLRRGSIALEMAIIAPICVIMMFGVYDISQALIIWQETYNAAQAVAQAGEKLSIIAGTNLTQLTASQMQDAMTSIYAEIPGLNRGDGTGRFPGSYSVTLSGVTFRPLCSTAANCPTQTPYTLWSSSLSEGGAKLIHDVTRQCGPLARAAVFPSTSATLSTMADPALTAPINVAPQVVADVRYVYMPMTTLYLIPITFWVSATFPAPLGNIDQEITVNTNSSTAGVTICPPPPI